MNMSKYYIMLISFLLYREKSAHVKVIDTLLILFRRKLRILHCVQQTYTAKFSVSRLKTKVFHNISE